MPGANHPSKQRQIRVFVSSTFRDMRAERDELIKRVFPRLRRLCEERGVTWAEVDLRWGVTDEQKAEDGVLPLCLAEIRRCRPYFIGILGERYGWIPARIPAHLATAEPWLAAMAGRSVTELEILHGVLEDPAMAGHAYFYFRDPAFVERLPDEERPPYLELPWPEEVAALGHDAAERRAAARRRKLADLKQRIRDSGLPLREGFADPAELGAWLYRDIEALIERQFPAAEFRSDTTRDAIEQATFASSRTSVYVERSALYARLDAHASQEGPPLVLLGPAGGGKSALLANWAQRARERDPERPCLVHFAGAGPSSADWMALLRGWLMELGHRLGGLVVPEAPAALREAFAQALLRSHRLGRLVLVLDGLDQLEDRDGAPDLVFLPEPWPAHVTLVASTLPGRSLDAATRRGWSTHELAPLSLVERTALIRRFLARFGKELDATRAARIAAHAQAANPLFLRVLLEELRQHGEHETLDEQIDHYLGAETVTDLYERVLGRWERDYDRERAGLVRDALSSIWAARRGVAEAELLDILGSRTRRLAGALWTPLFLAAEDSLVNRAGLLGFRHDYLRRAVERRYLARVSARRRVHRKVARYFAGRPSGERAVEELPWGLAGSGQWRRLAALLAAPDFFAKIWGSKPFDLKRIWIDVERRSRYRLDRAYQGILADPRVDAETLWHVATLLDDTGHPEASGAFRALLVDFYRSTGQRDGLQGALGNLALTRLGRGDWDEAMVLLREQEEICRSQGHLAGLQAALGNQALVHIERGALDDALAALCEQEAICRSSGQAAGLLAALANRALIATTRGDLELGADLLRQAERLARELGDHAALQAVLGSEAQMARTRGDLDRARKLRQEQEHVCREIGHLDGLRSALGGLAELERDLGRPRRALALRQEEEAICRSTESPSGLQDCLGNQALLCLDLGDLDRAWALAIAQEELCRELGSRDGLRVAFDTQGQILQARGDRTEGLARYREAERVCRDLGNVLGLQEVLGHQAEIHQLEGRFDDALGAAEEQERLCRDRGIQEGLARALWGQGSALHAQSRRTEARFLLEEAWQVASECGLTALLGHIEATLADLR